MRLILVLVVGISSSGAMAGESCELLAQKAAKNMAKLNKAAIGTELTQIGSTKLVAETKPEPNSRSVTHATYAIVLTDGKKMNLNSEVKTTKDNDQVNECAVDSVEMEPVFY